jgi:release factor glutamine methyltransferase
VETAVKLLPKGGRFLELCTGSGCIPVSLCKYRPDLRGVATDLFEETLDIAKRNAERNGVKERIEFALADVFDLDFWGSGKGKTLLSKGGFDAIISNPPYIPTKDIEDLSVEVKHEPIAALDGGADGLDFYRFIVGEYGKYLSCGGRMIFEIGYDQGEALSAIAEQNGYTCRIVKDLCGNDRVTVLEKNNKNI